MSGLLFLLNVAATVLIALWLWGIERSGEGWRVRIFDMHGQAAAETPPPDARPPTSFRRAPATPTSTRPRWRRSV
ncbi:MAG: hypothetical protein JWO83_3902 [Caulobacteraceae bacterium]|nr:hypothetical protein [Caulobacteraceae bacterium]